jgi:endonuclease/exonuclease/phosphatase family metal-dependent hydrolase
MQITVLQWNVWYKEDIENIAKLLDKYKPDIICLQELTRNFSGQNNIDTMQLLSDRLGYNFFAQDMPIVHPGEEWQQANAIFSRFPIIAKQSQWINEPTGTGHYDDEYRSYVEVTLQLKDKILTAGTTHMSYTDRFASTERKESEAAKLGSILSEKSECFIFAGDLNAPPESATLNLATSSLENVGPNFDTPTWTTKPFSYNGFKATELAWRLDYMFKSKDINVVSAEIIQTEYSDHLPILATLELA